MLFRHIVNDFEMVQIALIFITGVTGIIFILLFHYQSKRPHSEE